LKLTADRSKLRKPIPLLQVLPLHIREQLAGLAGAPPPRTWLLPLMRRAVAGASLAVWAQQLLVRQGRAALGVGVGRARGGAGGAGPLCCYPVLHCCRW
jgi:hypothetical protein